MAKTLRLEGDERRAMVTEIFSNWLAKHEARGHLDSDASAAIGQVKRLTAPKRRSPMASNATWLVTETTLVDDLSSTQEVSDDELRALDFPTLLLYGADSDLRSDGERLAKLLPHCELHLLPNCGHGILWQAKPSVVEKTTEWIRGL
jgi:pimeloyl-ACP methyl ester carboxylesterase